MGKVIFLEQYRAARQGKIKRGRTDDYADKPSDTKYGLNEEQCKLLEERPELMYFDIRKIL